MSHMRRVVGGGDDPRTVHFAITVYGERLENCDHYLIARTSCMLGTSSNSPNTNTPGEPVASRISFAAAAPLADLDMSRNGSTFARNPAPRSIFLFGTCRDGGECEGCGRSRGGKLWAPTHEVTWDDLRNLHAFLQKYTSH